MRAYVITLKNTQDRAEATARVLAPYVPNFEFFYGVDARIDKHPLLERFRPQTFLYNIGREGQIGEAGCYASHYLLWEKCVELNESIIIFEDDLAVEPSLFAKTLTIVKQHIDDCGFIRIENTKNHKLFYRVRDYGEQSLIKYLKIPQCTAGYAISPQTAKELIKKSQYFDYPVDVFLRNAWIHKQPIFAVHLAGLWGNNAPSIIGNRKRQGKKNYFVALMKIINKTKFMTLNLITNVYHLKKIGKNYKPLKLWLG